MYCARTYMKRPAVMPSPPMIQIQSPCQSRQEKRCLSEPTGDWSIAKSSQVEYTKSVRIVKNCCTARHRASHACCTTKPSTYGSAVDVGTHGCAIQVEKTPNTKQTPKPRMQAGTVLTSAHTSQHVPSKRGIPLCLLPFMSFQPVCLGS